MTLPVGRDDTFIHAHPTLGRLRWHIIDSFKSDQGMDIVCLQAVDGSATVSVTAEALKPEKVEVGGASAVRTRFVQHHEAFVRREQARARGDKRKERGAQADMDAVAGLNLGHV